MNMFLELKESEVLYIVKNNRCIVKITSNATDVSVIDIAQDNHIEIMKLDSNFEEKINEQLKARDDIIDYEVQLVIKCMN